jgi:predicted nucleic acid-binding protein
MPVNDSWIAATAIALGIPVAAGDPRLIDVPAGVDSADNPRISAR